MNIFNLCIDNYRQINEFMDISSFQNFSICMFLQNSDKNLSREYKKKFLEIKEILIKNSFHESILDLFNIQLLLSYPITTINSNNIYIVNMQQSTKPKIFFDVNNKIKNHSFFSVNLNYSFLRIVIFLSPQYLNNNIIEIYTQKYHNKRKDTHYTETLNGEIKDINNKGFLIYNNIKLAPFTNFKYLISKNFKYDSISINFKRKLFLLSPLDRHFSLM